MRRYHQNNCAQALQEADGFTQPIMQLNGHTQGCHDHVQMSWGCQGRCFAKGSLLWVSGRQQFPTLNLGVRAMVRVSIRVMVSVSIRVSVRFSTILTLRLGVGVRGG